MISFSERIKLKFIHGQLPLLQQTLYNGNIDAFILDIVLKNNDSVDVGLNLLVYNTKLLADDFKLEPGDTFIFNPGLIKLKDLSGFATGAINYIIKYNENI
jgi:hypothetical protein